jgi:hypothetical protein
MAFPSLPPSVMLHVHRAHDIPSNNASNMGIIFCSPINEPLAKHLLAWFRAHAFSVRAKYCASASTARAQYPNITSWLALSQAPGTNHAKKQSISLRLPNGKRAINDKENMSVMLPHCQRVFNNHKAVSPQALEHMKQ